MSRRDAIKMTDAEVLAFLGEERVMTCATNGPRGLPHLMPLWYVVRDGTVWAWTYGRSQKTRNLERDPRATVQVEAGGDQYHLLRGVMLECEVVVHRELEDVSALGLELAARYAPAGTEVGEEGRAAVLAQAPKRVALEFREQRRATWDHRKLGGTY